MEDVEVAQESSNSNTTLLNNEAESSLQRQYANNKFSAFPDELQDGNTHEPEVLEDDNFPGNNDSM